MARKRVRPVCPRFEKTTSAARSALNAQGALAARFNSVVRILCSLARHSLGQLRFQTREIVRVVAGTNQVAKTPGRQCR